MVAALVTKNVPTDHHYAANQRGHVWLVPVRANAPLHYLSSHPRCPANTFSNSLARSAPREGHFELFGHLATDFAALIGRGMDVEIPLAVIR